MLPYVSVVIITKNNIKTINECVSSLLDQTYLKENYEIIFVDGHSTDGTDKTIKKYAKNHSFLKLYYEDRGTMGYARNLGLYKSRGNIIAFTDADAVLPEDWLERIVEMFNDDKLVAVGGWDVMLSHSRSGRIMDSWRRLRKPRAHGIKAIPLIKTVNFAIRHDAVFSCGGFDPTLSHWDETELLARLYSKTKTNNIVYDPEIIVYHKRPVSTKITRRSKKIFKKSLIGGPVLMRTYMMKVALANPKSIFATSYYLILAWIVGIPILLLSILTGLFSNILILAPLLYLTMLCFYISYMFLRTRKVTLTIPLILTIDLAVRFAGTFLGLVKFVVNLFAAKSSKKPYAGRGLAFGMENTEGNT